MPAGAEGAIGAPGAPGAAGAPGDEGTRGIAGACASVAFWQIYRHKRTVGMSGNYAQHIARLEPVCSAYHSALTV